MSERSSVPSRSVVVCAYTLDRLALTERCLTATLAQDPPPDEVILVADHNDELARELRSRLPGVDVVANTGPRGLSGARNTGIGRATGDIVAFIDDDAEPRPGWLAGLTAAFADPAVMVVGGRATAVWESGQPGWFPDEFLWVVGCSYRGQPESGPVRNPLGCNMAFRREVFESVGGFDTAVGRLGSLPVGAEETELCLRIRRSFPGSSIVLVADAEVHHAVPASRARAGYFIRRCFYEGISKAIVREISAGDALGTERAYVVRILTSGIARRARSLLRLDRPAASLGGIVAIVGGTVIAAAGYAYGRVRRRFRVRRPHPAASTRRGPGEA